MSNSTYFEQRPVYLNEPDTITATVAGSGSIAGWTFAGHLYDASGNEIVGGISSATVTDADNRIVTVVVAGQSVAGDYVVEVRRTDDSSNLVVVRGAVEVTDPRRL